ncbi:hypothetical protein EMIT0P258_20506 [Pseudomonas sp. IT-P258]
MTGSCYSSRTIAHKKGRCKGSGQSKTLDQELQINVSEHGVTNRILNSSEIFQSRRRPVHLHRASRWITVAARQE